MLLAPSPLTARAVKGRALPLHYSLHLDSAAVARLAGTVVDHELVLKVAGTPIARHVVAQGATTRAYRELLALAEQSEDTDLRELARLERQALSRAGQEAPGIWFRKKWGFESPSSHCAAVTSKEEWPHGPLARWPCALLIE